MDDSNRKITLYLFPKFLLSNNTFISCWHILNTNKVTSTNVITICMQVVFLWEVRGKAVTSRKARGRRLLRFGRGRLYVIFLHSVFIVWPGSGAVVFPWLFLWAPPVSWVPVTWTVTPGHRAWSRPHIYRYSVNETHVRQDWSCLAILGVGNR